MRVLLADDHTNVRWALRTVLGEEDGLTVVGEVTEACSFLVQAEALKPDLILLEWELPGRPAESLMADLSALDLDARVIVLSGRPEHRKAALAAGADAFLSKSDAPDQVLTTLQRLAAG
jgi:DNA-binding NarL/FixJ family response regulator